MHVCKYCKLDRLKSLTSSKIDHCFTSASLDTRSYILWNTYRRFISLHRGHVHVFWLPAVEHRRHLATARIRDTARVQPQRGPQWHQVCNDVKLRQSFVTVRQREDVDMRREPLYIVNTAFWNNAIRRQMQVEVFLKML